MIRPILFIVGTLFFLSSPSFAAQPPDAFLAQEKNAPEQLTIKVQSVSERRVLKKSRSVDFNKITFRVSAKVEVLDVERSAAGLIPGKIINLSYQREEFVSPMPGNPPSLQLKEGGIYPALLKKTEDGDSYAPYGWACFYRYEDIYGPRPTA